MRDIVCLCVLAVLTSFASAVPVNKTTKENETTPSPSPSPTADYSGFTGNFYDYFTGASIVIEYFYDTTGSSVLPSYEDYSLPTGFFDYVSGFQYGSTTPSSSTTPGGSNSNSDSSSASGEAVPSLRHGNPVALVEGSASASEPWWAADSNSSADELIDLPKDANIAAWTNASDMPTADRMRPAVMPFIMPATTDLANQTFNDLPQSNASAVSSGIMRPAVLPFKPLTNSSSEDLSLSNDSTPISSGIMRPAVLPFIPSSTNTSSGDLSSTNGSVPTLGLMRPAVMPYIQSENNTVSLPAILPYVNNDTIRNDGLIGLSENQSSELVDPMFSVPVSMLTNSSGNASAIIPTGLPNQIKKGKLDTINTLLPGKLKNWKKNKTAEVAVEATSIAQPVKASSSSEESNEVANRLLADSGNSTTEAPQKLIKVKGKGKVDLDEEAVTGTAQPTGSTDKPGEKSALENAVNPVVQSVISNWHNRNSELLGQIQRT